MTGDSIRFLLNREEVEVSGMEPTRTVLAYLREQARLTGTKEGCAEGDCGACTVVLGQLDGERLEMLPVNACIQFVPTLDGKALFTVESLRGPRGDLHPVQQAMVDCHGSQCGFCTPGFVMSLWGLYLEPGSHGEKPDELRIRTALTGNLCRCTGYRPILEAAQRMFELPAAAFDAEAIRRKLLALRRDRSMHYTHAGRHFFAPRSLAELARLRAEHPGAVILAGCTDIGLWVTKQLRELETLIFVGHVEELKQVRERDGWLRLGAAVSLNDGFGAIARHYPGFQEMWERFASTPIRNAGTLGGNVANGSPIGDSMPGLIALGARVVLRNRERSRTLPMEELYLDYMKNAMQADEILEAVEVPLPDARLRFRTYKSSKRFDSDISAVCAAFAIRLEGEVIGSARVAFGGMAATPRRAPAAEAALLGQPWSEATAQAAARALSGDYAPLSDMRSTAEFRGKVAGNLVQRFFLETRTANPLPASAVNVRA